MRIGVDIGGTKIEAVALADDGKIIDRRRKPTPTGDYQSILDVVSSLARGLEADMGETATVGVAMPGTISPGTGLMRYSNALVMNGKPFANDIGEVLGREVRTENDANCLALSEAVDGAAMGAACVFGIILGTGVGGGLVIDRKLVPGRNRIAGEVGHIALPLNEVERRMPPRRCFCGQDDCVETFLSGGAFSAEHRQRTGKDMSATSIAEAAANGDGAAQATLEVYVDRLARALAVVMKIVDPDVFVFGGGVSKIPQLYDLLPPLLARYVYSDVMTTRVLQAGHGDSSGVRGAAWLWPR
ncbi:MAG TPA: ROK family protein [Methylovirgula sp.]